MDADVIRDVTLDQCVVLSALVAVSRQNGTPANPAELRAICNDRLAETDSPVAGGLSEADVTRALYELESVNLVENVEDKTSPTGKGRPAYLLVPDCRAVRDALTDRGDIEPV